MKFISRPERKKSKFVVHISNGIRPVCGGGRLARLVTGWQEDIGPANCKRCTKITSKIKTS